MEEKKQKQEKKTTIDQKLLELKARGIIDKIRHTYPMIRKDLEKKDHPTSEPVIEDTLNKLKDEGFLELNIDLDKQKVTYLPTLKARETTYTNLVEENGKKTLLMLQCLYNITFKDIEDRRIRIFEIGQDLYNNYRTNLFEAIRKHRDLIGDIKLTDEELDSLEKHIIY